MKASGLSPTEFDRAVDMLGPVVAMQPTRRRRSAPAQAAQKSNLSHDELLAKAKAVQTGKPFKKDPKVGHPIAPPDNSLTRLRESLAAEQQQARAVSVNTAPEKPAASVSKPQTTRSSGGGRGSGRGRAEVSRASPPDQNDVQWMSVEDENAIWARILGKRIGIGHTEEPPRKRGRPRGSATKKEPAPPPAMLPPAPDGEDSSYPPPRYSTVLPLDEKELHVLRPLPIPLVMPTRDPSMPTIDAQRVWERWRAAL